MIFPLQFPYLMPHHCFLLFILQNTEETTKRRKSYDIIPSPYTSHKPKWTDEEITFMCMYLKKVSLDEQQKINKKYLFSIGMA